jgi:hypothetical protein
LVERAEEDDDDDPVEQALFTYEKAFEDAGDPESAGAFDEARETYSQGKPSSSGTNESWEPGASTPWRNDDLAPPPTSDRSIFDDIDR